MLLMMKIRNKSHLDRLLFELMLMLPSRDCDFEMELDRMTMCLRLV